MNLIRATFPFLAVVTLTLLGAISRLHATEGMPPKESNDPKYSSVDQIKGIGKFTFGSKLSDYPPGLLRIIDPRAKGVLLRVSPYGDNYLVTDLKGLTWGNIPLTGLIATFHDGLLIDLQVALKAKKVDFYLADRAFKDKYGQSEPKTFPVETWTGKDTQVTLVFVGPGLTDPAALNAPAQGKVELFNHAQWRKYEAARMSKLNEILDQQYQQVGPKVKSNL